MPTELDDWFVREVLVHERALVLFLQRAWPHRDEWHDLRQEAYARVYEAAARARPDAPKAFLFATARHLMTDRLRRSRVVSIESVGDFESSNVYLIDEVSPERWTGTRQALKRMVEALDRLPDRCREVVWLRRVEELPQKDVARQLGISEKTVEKHLAKGMRLLADHLYGGDAVRGPVARTAARPVMDEDDGHDRQQSD
ncbi:sigma-70 family RNA polymerase sigma factor [Pseudoxanthomonas sp. PXM03]|jgi:RNA polymerase sigma factor (sigma-70 family)|uniref:RNA polymerase sigma factor n=1 Tax=unclassified Pseudoxanthomonas TaxID=2645906 RepID=UPI0017809D86|nr:sigma-70 family RNA polymerase sigma factor [Pseudoxanthomonas sp. PXM03]MBD9437733.1 sigma-70 family RNA polymerase sigma factor [Pseudoxanthomonas sp. PXM03]